MGTASLQWELWSTTARLVVSRPNQLEPAKRIVDRMLSDVEQAASRFRPDSEILNLWPDETGRVLLSPTLTTLIRRALDAAQISDGRLDPTVGGTLDALGYDRDIRLVIRDGAPVRTVVRTLHGWRRLMLDGSSLRLPAGTRLDLGATAKAVAADQCVAAVADRLDTGALLSLGGDIATAGPPPSGGWQVLVQDRAEDPATQITLHPGTAVATSSTQARQWRRGDEMVHHIVDPRTGRSADSPWRSVAVVADSCFAANTASTTTIVRGDDGLSWLAGLGLPARLVHLSGSVVTLAGWPRDDLEAA